jgi:hypothetical protein
MRRRVVRKVPMLTEQQQEEGVLTFVFRIDFVVRGEPLFVAAKMKIRRVQKSVLHGEAWKDGSGQDDLLRLFARRAVQRAVPRVRPEVG